MQIYQGYWVGLPSEVRDVLRKQFNVGKSGGVIVSDGRLLSDGSNDENLKVINTESLQDLLGSKETDFEKLLGNAIAYLSKINNLPKVSQEPEEIGAVEDIPTEEIVEEAVKPVKVAKKKPGRPKKK